MLVLTVGAVQAQNPLSKLFTGGVDEEPLAPELAFRLDVVSATQGLLAEWQIAKGYYLYRHKIKITANDRDAMLQLPLGETITDEFFGESQIFRGFLQVPFQLASISEDDQIKVTYQGCADLGVCYPPITQVIAMREELVLGPSNSAPVAPIVAAVNARTQKSAQEQIAEGVGQRTILATMLVFLGFGLLLAFTPCILPMLPILSGIIAGSGEGLNTRRAFALSLAYVLPMAVTYAIAGVIIGLTGESFQAVLQTPWVIILFSLVFVFLALAMFGLYELKVPSAIQTRLSRVGSDKQGSLLGAAIMGGVSVLIVGPCVTPALVGALLFIAQTGEALTGGAALFSLGIGMGLPLLIVGSSLGKWLPKPGPALDISKVIFGILLLAVAIWMIDRIVTVSVTQYLAATLLIVSAIYFLRITVTGKRWQFFWQGLGGLILVYGVLLAIAAATGGGSFLKPLEHLTARDQDHSKIAFQQIDSLDELQQHQQQATHAQQPLMLDFYADWCVTCKEMDAFTFSKPQVHQALSSVVKLQADVTGNDSAHQALMKHFNIFGPPAILFFDANGQEVPGSRLVGFVDADDFIRHIQRTFPASGSPPQSQL